MIISHKHKFIFIKTFKVSGTSMEIALSNYLGDKDIATPINLEEEIIRFKKTKTFPKNYLDNVNEEIKYNRLIKKLTKMRLSKKKLNILEQDKEKRFSKMIYHNHMSAIEIRRRVGRKIWNNYFKFTIERNPYDKVISFMFFANRFKKINNISSEINKTISLKKYLNYPLYLDSNNKKIVDFIINFSALNKGILYIQKKLKFDLKKYYFKTKNYTRKDKRNFKNILDKDQMKNIYNDSKVEFKIMGYKK